MTSPWAHPLYKISIELSATQITRFFFKKAFVSIIKAAGGHYKTQKIWASLLTYKGTSQVAQMLKHLPAIRETKV